MAKIEHSIRLKALRAGMKKRGLDAMIVREGPSARYLSGFTGSNAMILVDAKTTRFITDSRYSGIVGDSLEKCFDIVTQPTRGTADFFKDIFRKSRYRNIGFEQSITYQQFETLKGYARGSKLVGAQDAVLELRAVKEDAELALIKKATKLADDMMALAISSLKVGMTEWDLSKIIRRASEDLGGEGESFGNIVASGPNAAKPHHRGSTRKIRKGDMVTIDLGGVVGGYCSDLTRTVCVGSIAKGFEDIYYACLGANESAIEGIRPGMTGDEADSIARKVIDDAGFGKYFGHGLGHGVGLEIHEAPSLAPERKNVLKPGNIITIEPGIYVPGFGGVRIEDYALVTEKGVKVFSKSPKILTVVPG